MRSRSEAGSRRLDFSDLGNQALYVLLIVIPAIILEGYHKVRGWLTGVPKGHPQGSWQWALHFTLREDPAHHTNETVGYYRDRPAEATDLDDLTAWVMTVIQFLWSYDDLMGVTWHEWAMLRFVTEAAQLGGLGNHNLFHRLQRQWELARPYNAPLNGTYADVRRAAFNEFITPRLEALPADLQEYVFSRYARARPGREQYQAQMSLRARLMPGRYRDTKEPLALWETYIGLIVKGHYYLINVVAHDENGDPLVYGQGGMSWPLRFEGRQPVGPSGEELIIRQDQVYRADDSTWVGYLDMAPASCVKWQLREVLRDAAHREALSPDRAVDILLAETPRRAQRRLRKLLPPKTQTALESLSRAPILINWDVLNRDRSLAELRRAHRGIGDHALVIMRTESSIIFDQS
ncbi:MAG TPA: hypothetical protein ENI95_10040, partial [Chloroflexi bacterium]|nr:hypothetical protein [Chloroflexota bacterium]